MLTQIKDFFEKKVLLVVITLVLLSVSLILNPYVRGDAPEYMGMTISIKNHITPDLREEDILERDTLYINSNFKEMPKHLLYKNKYVNYFKAPNGKYYGFHFGAYSLLCALFWPILVALKINPLKVFQFTNALLLILMYWWIWYRTTLSDKLKYYLTGITFISPIWLYFNWMHPEIYTYVFVFIALLEFLEKRKLSACAFAVAASLQNPAAILISFFIMLYSFIKNKFKIDKELVLLGIISLVWFIPYAVCYYNFHFLSLVGKYTTSLEYITLAKILSLFFDLTFGLIVYVPVIVIGFLYACFKKNKLALVSLVLMLLIALVDSTQINWNNDMNLIHRYAFWLIPIMIVSTLNIVEALEWNTLKKVLIIYLITTGFWLVYALDKAATYYAQFQPVAKIVLNIAPSLYNPVPSVFYERTVGEEISFDDTFKDRLPLNYYYGKDKRKTLIYDTKVKKYKYINGKINLTNIKIAPIKIKTKKKIYTLSNHGIIIKERN